MPSLTKVQTGLLEPQGVATITTGTASAPGLVFSNSSTAGIYSPGVNQIAISTASTGRLFVDASGNLGVGSTPVVTAGRSIDMNGGLLQPLLYLRATSATAATTTYTLNTTNSSVDLISSDWPIRCMVNGYERLRIASDGKVGIGTSAPSQDLHVNNVSTAAVIRVSSGTAGANTSVSSIDLSSSFSGSGVEGTSKIASYAPAGGQSDLAFLTSPSGNAPTERLRITSTGLVGIGTTAPSTKLHVYGAGGNLSALLIESSTGTDGQIRFKNTSGYISTGLTGAGGNTYIIYDGLNSRSGYQYNGLVGGDYHVWATNNVERLRITNDGKVGISTTSPDALLTVNGVGAFGVGNPVSPSIAITGDLNTGIYSPGPDQLAISTGGTGRLFVHVSGNVGIGISIPSNTLHLYGFSGCALRLESGSNSIPNEINFRSPAGRTAKIVSSYTNPALTSETYLAFHTNVIGSANDTVAESMRIVGGKVGIGTTNPQARLEIATTGTYGVIYQPAVYIRNVSFGGISGNPTGLGAINWNVDGFYDVANIEAVREVPTTGTLSALVFRTNPTNMTTGEGTERLRITSTGNVGIGTTNPDQKLVVNGNMCVNTTNLPSGASADAIISVGRSVVASKYLANVVNNGTLDLAIITSGSGCQGFLTIANSSTSNAVIRTQTTYSIFIRGLESTITQIATANGSGGARTFTVTVPANGTIRVTNTSGSNCDIDMQFFGGISL